MTILMSCLDCNTTVKNPRIFNYMYEKCTPCAIRQKEQEDKALSFFTNADKKARDNAS